MGRREIKVSEEKQSYATRINACLDKYSRVLFVGFENVRSQQIHDIRAELRGKAELVMGKKTLQRKIVKIRATRSGASENDQMFFEKTERLDLLRKMSALLFTNCEVAEIQAILDKHRIQAPARVGAVSPVDVIIPAGNTGMEPTQTSFFQALNIATKITKGTVEIINDKKVLGTGDKVDNSTAVLLKKLKISPFWYQMETLAVWDRGVVFTTEDLAVTDSVIEKLMGTGISNLAAISLGAGIPTSASVPIVAVECFKNLLSASIATGYSFTEFGAEKTIADARSGKLTVAAAPAAAAPAAAPKAAAKAAAKEESEDDDMGGLF